MAGTITKEILKQYADMQIEIEGLKADLKKTEDAIDKLIEEGTVKDRVYGGEGGIQGFNIEGFPAAEYNRRVNLHYVKRAHLLKRENDLLELTNRIDKLIAEIPDSRDRAIFHDIFIERKKQWEVAEKLHVDRSLISKIIDRYL